MSKRKYTHMKEIEPELLAMRKAGYTRQEMADKPGLKKTDQEQDHPPYP